MSIFSFIKSHAVMAGTVVAVAVVATVIGGRVAQRTAATDTTGSNTKHVSLIESTRFLGDSGSVSVDGVIQSVTQVDLKSQISAPLATISVALGDHVTQGQVIAELSNADIRAQYQSAQAALTIAAGTYSSARQGAIEKVRSAYIAADTAIHGQVDQYILNTISPTPQFFTYVTDPTLGSKIRDERNDLNTRFGTWKTSVDSLSASSSDSYIHAAIVTSEENLDSVSMLLDHMSSVLSSAGNIAPSGTLASINTIQTVVSNARASISASKSALVTAEGSLEGAQGSVGSAALAGVSVAEANVRNLQAQLAKTQIISPISGTIAALPLKPGELAAPGTLIATIVGPGDLQVDAYASAEDIGRITRGARAHIGSTILGTVSSVATAVNPLNRKVEVKILVSDPAAATSLVIGQNVSARIDTAAVSAAATSKAAYHVPIQNVKIVPGEAYVFTVDADSKLVRHDVILGAVKGDYVEITSGITPDMKIVSPIYELEAGQQVIVD